MYKRFLKAAFEDADAATISLMEKIHGNPGTWHYLVARDEVTFERISKVVKDVLERLESRLTGQAYGNAPFDFYEDLGAKRRREGMALEQVAGAILLIKGECLERFPALMAAHGSCPGGDHSLVSHYLNLIFAGIFQSTVSGYTRRQESCPCQGTREHLLRKALKI